ncbi:glycosyltransferase [uncultured Dialister sp.]|jgi:glycosyltransferase involved in cell wall biosynthesis|uniref:glycosyltransferase n=1 Tax=uncultured Dialister sp. TaxID=278064 RepID=UPI0025D83558|nr:glycosyltransferase [uncultured Dialister sp.]
MKFLIIAFHPRSMTPYAKQYEDAISKAGHEYDIFLWDRFSNGSLEKLGNEFIFHRICTLGGNKLKKIYPFYLFRNTVKKIIKEGKYDKIIVLNTMPGFLLHDVLLKQYKNRFLLDIRDYTYEKISFYLKVVHQLIDSSFFTTISSRGFEKFLGENKKIILNHNISNLDKVEKYPSLDRNNKKITIGFVGAVRYYDENIALIESFKQSSRFNLAFYGREASDCHLEEYCKNHQIKNIEFSGAFQNEEKPTLYKKIDIINSLYGNQKIEVLSALPNRLYDALIFKKPLIVTEGTYLAEIVEKYGIGISLPGSQVHNGKIYEEKISEYVSGFNKRQFTINANQLLEKVNNEQERFHHEIDKFVQK